MRQPILSQIWFLPVIILLITGFWFVIFPFQPPTAWDLIVTETVFLLATLIACVAVTRWGLKLMQLGACLFGFARLIELIDEFTLEPEIWDSFIPTIFELIGLAIAIVAILRLDRFRRGELEQAKRQEQALRESEAQFQDLYENAADAIFTTDQQGNFISFNRIALEYSGYARDEIQHLNLTDLLTPENIPLAIERMGRMFATQDDLVAEQPWEYQVVRKDGSRFPAEVRTRAIWRGDKIVGLQGIARDVTTRKQTELALQRREAILSSVSFAAGQFLQAMNWRQSIPQVLAQLGQATDVSRVYLFENFYDSNDTLFWRQVFEWVAPGITPQIDNPELAAVDVVANGAGRWETEMRQRRSIVGVVREFPASERMSLEAQDIQSLVAVPVFVGEEWWGFIGFDDCVTARQWSTGEVDSLRAAANTLGAAIAREQIDRALNDRTRHLALLNDVTRAAIAAQTMPELLQTLADRMGELFHANHCHLTLWDEATRQTIPAAAYGRWRETFATMTLSPGQATLTSSVLHAQHAIAVNDVTTTELVSAQLVNEFQMRSVLVLPLIAGVEKLGAVILMFEDAHCFTPDEIARGEQAATQLSLAIAKTRLLEQAHQRAAHMALLNEISRAVSTLSNLEQVLESIYEQTRQAIPSDAFFIAMYDPATKLLSYPLLYDDSVRFSSEPNRRCSGTVEQVIETRQGICINRSAEEMRAVDQTYMVGNKSRISGSLLYVPLIIGERVLGVMSAQTYQLNAYTDEHLNLLNGIGYQAAIAIENARLFDETREHARDLAWLNEITRAAMGAPTMRDLTQMLANRLGELFHADGCHITFWDQVNRRPMPMAAFGRRQVDYASIVPLVGEKTLTESVLDEKHALVVDASSVSSYISPRIVEQFVAQSALALPLIAGEEKLGAVILLFEQPHHFTSSEIVRGEQAAAQMSLAIAKAKSVDQAQERLVRVTALHEIDVAITSTLDLGERLEILLDQTMRLMHADLCTVFLADPKTHLLKMIAHRGAFEREQWQALALVVGEGATGWVAQNAQPLALSDVNSDPRWVQMEISNREGLRSYLGAPLRVRDRVIGVLDMGMRTRREFSAEEIDFFVTLAGRAAIALENARLFEETRYHANRVETLRQAGAAIVSTLEQNQAIQIILEQLARVVPYDSASVQLLRDGYLEIVGGRGWADGASVLGVRFPVPGDNPNTLVVQECREHILANAPASYTNFRQAPHAHILAWLGVPLIVRERVIGMLALDKAQANFYTPEHAEWARAFSDQVAIALENARLFEETRQRALEFAALYETTRDIAMPHSLVDLLRLIVERAVGLLDARGGGGMYLCEPEQSQVRCVVSYNTLRDYAGVVLKYGEGASGKVALTGEPLIINDYREWSGRAATYEEDQPFTSVLCVPILWQGRVIGTLDALDDVAHRRFTQADLQLLTLFANQAAAMIENSRLFDETKRRADQIETLYSIGQTLNSTLETDVILDTVMDVALRTSGATHGCLCIVDRSARRFSYRALRGFTDDQAQRTRVQSLSLDQGLNGRAFRTRQIVRVDDVTQSPEYVEYIPDTRSEVIVPIVRGGQVIGNIDLQSPKLAAFHDADLEFLSALADQAGIALDNAQLFDQVRQRAREQTIVNDITRALNIALDVRAAFFAIAEGVRALVASDRVSLALLSADRKTVTMYALDQPRAELSEGTRFPISATAAAEDVLAGRVHLTANLEDEMNYAAEQVLCDTGYRSRVNLPLIVGDQSIGSLNLVSRHLGHFNATHLPPLQQIANAIAIAIENTRLFEAEQARRAELGSLYNLSRALADLNDAQAIMEIVTQRGVETTRCAFTRLVLYENNYLAVRAAHPARVIGRDLEVGRRELMAQLPVMLRTTQSSTPMLLFASDPSLSEAERQFLLLDWARTVCMTPLRIGERVLGCLMFGEVRSQDREPFDEDKLRLARSIGDQTASALHRAELFGQMESAFVQTVLALAQAMDVKDSYTANHAERLAVMSTAIGRELGFTANELEELRFGATLHDVGKIGVPDAILQKNSTLTREEWQRMRRHPSIGEQILAPVPRLSGAARIVRHHHERFDGTGYPDGLAGEQIPLGARILTVVDSYSAITDRRVYKRPRSHKIAIAELRRNAGTQFDPQIVEIFLRLFEHASK